MKLTCIGKYGPYPKANCACSSYILQTGEKNIILDMGCASLPRIFSLLEIKDIDAVVLSHLHSDHMGDMLTMRYALAAARKLGKRQDPLDVYMPSHPETEAGLISSEDMFKTHFLTDGEKIDICGIQADFALMPHAVPSYAMSFYSEGKKLVYSGDTSYSEKLIKFAQEADMLLLEAAFLSENMPENPAHMSAAEAAKTGTKAGAKRLLLTHIFPEYSEADLLNEARGHYPESEIIEELNTYEV